MDFLVYDGSSNKHAEWIQGKVSGVQASIVAVPVVQAYEQALQSVKRGGRIVALWIVTKNVSVQVLGLILGGIEFVGSVVGIRSDLQEALELAKLQ